MSTRRIFKYFLGRYPGEVAVTLPQGWIDLAVQAQQDEVMLWANVEPSALSERVRFMLIPTGGDVPPSYLYLGTVQLFSGNLVWHVFVESSGV